MDILISSSSFSSPYLSFASSLPTALVVATAPVVLFSVFVAVKLAVLFWAHCLRSPHHLGERYGKGSWAVILGGSQGIGLEFAKQLAADHGLNVVVMSRSRANLDAAQEQILAAVKEARERRRKSQSLIDSTCSENSKCDQDDVQVRTVVIDFAESGSVQFWEQRFMPSLKDLDVSVVVLNVGQNNTNRFCDISPANLLEMINVNATSHMLAARYLLPQLQQRTIAATASTNKSSSPLRSAIITVSSMIACRAVAYVAPYCGTKSLTDLLSQSLHHESQQRAGTAEAALTGEDNVDFLTFRPAYVATHMSKIDLSKSQERSFFVLTAEESVRKALTKLGHVSTTFGSLIHVCYAWTYLNLLPNCVVRRLRENRLRIKKAKAVNGDDAE